MIKKSLPGAAVSFKEVRDREATENFEVKVNGKLLHSNKTQGHGFLHLNQETFAAVITEIQMV